MQLGIVGLGRMGANMARRLLRGGHECVVTDVSEPAVRGLESEGAVSALSLDELVQKVAAPRAIWLMLPAGEITERTLADLAQRLAAGDLVVDGGNTHYKDDVRRARMLGQRSIEYVDVGTSGGVWGLERGYCLMIGGPVEAVSRLDPVFRTLAPEAGGIARTQGANPQAERGYLHCGPAGAGHFVKMIHNAIEYGLMQAYAEGFDIMRNAASNELPAEQRYELDLPAIAELWRRGSVVSSWLLDLAARALAENPTLSNYAGVVADSGETRWAVQAALEASVPAHVISTALYTRFRSRRAHAFGERLLSAMRYEFGGHAEPPRDET